MTENNEVVRLGEAVDRLNAKLAAKDAEIATLKACLAQREQSIIDAKKRELAGMGEPAADVSAPTVSLDSKPDGLWINFKSASGGARLNLDNVVAERGPVTRRIMEEAIMDYRHSVPASVPTDERAAFEADYTREVGRPVQAWEFEAAWGMMLGDMWRAARAAAPVSGPSGHAKPPVSIDQQMARWAIDGAILKGRTGEAGPPSADHWLNEYWRIGQQLSKLGETSPWDNVTPVDSAAPVSGQGASELPEPWHRYTTNTVKQREPRNNRESAMCAEIVALRAALDSRPRSEDSRAKVLLDQLTGLATDAGFPNISTAIAQARWGVGAAPSSGESADTDCATASIDGIAGLPDLMEEWANVPRGAAALAVWKRIDKRIIAHFAPAAHSSAPSDPIAKFHDECALATKALATSDAALAAPTGESLPVQGVPEGWKLMPRLATNEMVKAAYDLDTRTCIWEAMFDAAPAPTGASK